MKTPIKNHELKYKLITNDKPPLGTHWYECECGFMLTYTVSQDTVIDYKSVANQYDYHLKNLEFKQGEGSVR